MKTQSRRLNSFKNISTGIIGQIFLTGISFFNRTIFIYCLSTDYLGINGLFTNILSLLSLAELGIGTAMTYALYEPLANKNNEKLKSLMGFYAKAYRGIGIIVILFGILLMPFLDVFIKESPTITENIRIIYLFFLFNSAITYFFSYKQSLIMADQKNYVSLITSYGITIVQSIFQIIILIFTKNYILYLLTQSVMALLYNIIISKIADRLYPFLKDKNKIELKKESKDELFVNIKALVVIKLSGLLVNNTDNIIISYFSGLSTVGLASNYIMLITIITTILTQIFNGITASVGNMNAKLNNESKEVWFERINFLNFWLYGLCAICITILINDVILIWLGDGYLLPFPVIVIMAINFYTVGMQSSIWMYKNTMGLFKYGRFLLLLTAIINLVLSFILGEVWGLFGVLLATFISRLLTNLWYDPYAVYKYGFHKNIKLYLKTYFLYLIVIVLSYLMCYQVSSFITCTGLLTLILKIIVTFITINLLFVVFFIRNKDFQFYKSFIFQMLSKLKVIIYGRNSIHEKTCLLDNGSSQN